MLGIWLLVECFFRGRLFAPGGLLVQSVIAVRTDAVAFEMYFSTMGTLDDVSGNFNPATGADGCFVANLVAALRAFDNHDSYVFFESGDLLMGCLLVCC